MLPGRNGKPLQVIISEGNKRHLTKKEIATRAKGEKSLLTGISLREWQEVKEDLAAHKEFTRLRRLLKKIQHDDALYEAVINRYCLLVSECKQFEVLSTQLTADIQELREMVGRGEIDPVVYLDQKGSAQDRLLAVDKRLMEKRKMLLSIEKENIMTILAALRAVPKKPEDKGKSKMASFLESRQAK